MIKLKISVEHTPKPKPSIATQRTSTKLFSLDQQHPVRSGFLQLSPSKRRNEPVS